MQARIDLLPVDFVSERTLIHTKSLSARLFQFPRGVAGVTLSNDRGEVVLLPFQGQQIWAVQFDRRELAMRSMVKQPYPTQDFLRTFGGFLQHCGITAVGGPGPEDSHPLHGELPNAPYDSAYLLLGEDERGEYIGLGGTYRHTVAFTLDYSVEPLVKLYQGSTMLSIEVTVTNHKRTPMEMFYLAHVNFRPVDGAQLFYSAPRSAEHVRVRASIPSHIQPGPGYREFLAELTAEPTRHERLASDLPFDPEVVFFIDYLADDAGWAHTLQVHPDGKADYIRHRPEQLPKATRWISRTPDQDAIALAEVGTSEPEGYMAEKAKGNVHRLGGGEQFYCHYEAGALSASDVAAVRSQIEQLQAK